jgi:hypothetical protein
MNTRTIEVLKSLKDLFWKVHVFSFRDGDDDDDDDDDDLSLQFYLLTAWR